MPGRGTEGVGQRKSSASPGAGLRRHFTICQHLGITMIPVADRERWSGHGPPWSGCRVGFARSRGSGAFCTASPILPAIVYGDAVCGRMAALGTIAAPGTS